VTAGDAADRKGHGHHGEPEGKCDAEIADPDLGNGDSKDGAAVAIPNCEVEAHYFRLASLSTADVNPVSETGMVSGLRDTVSRPMFRTEPALRAFSNSGARVTFA